MREHVGAVDQPVQARNVFRAFHIHERAALAKSRVDHDVVGVPG